MDFRIDCCVARLFKPTRQGAEDGHPDQKEEF
jgi:hypothetical protein